MPRSTKGRSPQGIWLRRPPSRAQRADHEAVGLDTPNRRSIHAVGPAASVHFFRALQRSIYCRKRLSRGRHTVNRPSTESSRLRWPLLRWREQYHSSVGAIPKPHSRRGHGNRSPSGSRRDLADRRLVFCACRNLTTLLHAIMTVTPHFWYRYYGRGLLSDFRVRRHLDWERKKLCPHARHFRHESMAGELVRAGFWRARTSTTCRRAGHQFRRTSGKDRAPTSRHPDSCLSAEISSEKGASICSEAFRIVRKGVPTAELTIVGPRYRRAGTWRALMQASCAKVIRRSLRTLSEIFCASTAWFCHPSMKPFGISLLEGMANYCLVIAVDRCALAGNCGTRREGLIAKPETRNLCRRHDRAGAESRYCQAHGWKVASGWKNITPGIAVVSKIQEVLAARTRRTFSLHAPGSIGIPRQLDHGVCQRLRVLRLGYQAGLFVCHNFRQCATIHAIQGR